MAGLKFQRHALELEQDGDHDGRDAAARRDRRGDIDTVIERESGRNMIGAHHERDEQQGAKGLTGQGLTGRHLGGDLRHQSARVRSRYTCYYC